MATASKPKWRPGGLPTIDDSKEVLHGGPETSDGPQCVDINPSELRAGKQVGSGQFATVFSGTWKGNTVAIKRISLKSSVPSSREQVQISRELAVLSKVNFENVVQFFGMALSNKLLDIVMEFCEGGTLFDLCHDSDIDVTWLQQHKMISDIAHAVRYLHNLRPQIIHRDLKSLNLLLSKPLKHRSDVPVVKVTDFGFSKFNDMSQVDWGKMTKNVGTCHWMAPEVINGSRYDDKADVYSFSIVVYEIVCLTIPFGNLEPEEAARKTARGLRPPLEEVPPDCPATLKDLMVKCWTHSPVQRPSFEYILVQVEGPVARAFGATSRPVSL